MFTSNSPEETSSFGGEWSRRAAAGDVFALVGELGAGKTQFVKGFVAAIGSDAEVTSPTFTLVHEYSGGRLPVYHFDFYRLENANAVLNLGFDDYLEAGGVCLIEWADRFPQLLPENAITITLSARGETERIITRVETP
ncbi:MAG: tRNA (adenosine(37)-N6)-threonylcarbamoyltransferase complex ATPase subunit type 1 TsaE [Chthoniobacterales bacterium]